ncbi:MAG: FAD binding domain-containing protein, partial [Chloroflexota bacterium]|nr:FAD binding domain-containing protein [Chloroflexota bacterium]
MGSYLRPASMDEALSALDALPRTVLAGGTDIYPARVGRVMDDDVLDISGLPDLRTITVADGVCRIPAQATWSDLLRHDLPPAFDGLKAAARAVGGI